MAKRDEQLLQEIERLQRQLADRDEQEGGVMGFLGGLALGTLLGGALALIFAPQSGEQMREQLRDTSIQLRERATQLTDQVKEQAGTVQEQAQGALGQVKEQAQKTVDTAKQQAQGVMGRAQEATGAVTEQARQTADTAKEQAQGVTAKAREAVDQTKAAATQPGQGATGQGQAPPRPQGGSYSSAAMRPSSAETTPQPELERHYGNPEEQSKPGGQQ
jgi:gas vesicle protein